MSGPPPKHPSERRRRNKAPEPVKLPAGPTREVPVLPHADELLASTREWWMTVWSSPMAAAYVDADVPGLARLARLVDKAERDGLTATVLSELRMLEDRYGLNPVSRRRLQWELQRAGDQDEVPANQAATGDERWLRAVSG